MEFFEPIAGFICDLTIHISVCYVWVMLKLIMSKFSLIIGCSLFLQGVATNCIAQGSNISGNDGLSSPDVNILETGVLQNVIGYRGDVLGAEVISVFASEDDLREIIELSIPIDPDLVDRVSIVSPSGKRIELEQPPEISRDDENNKVGIILKRSKKTRLGFKIRLIDFPDE